MKKTVLHLSLGLGLSVFCNIQNTYRLILNLVITEKKKIITTYVKVGLKRDFFINETTINY
jgi:hypothetical protein